MKSGVTLTKCYIILLFMMLPQILKSQVETIVFHNCENFFYPTNDPLTNDDNFTPEAPRHWTMERFNLKKDLIAKTYIDLSKGNLPAIIGLCEIENNQVLEALCYDSPLRKGKYKYIHYDSKDIRGIDVAMIYREDRFKVIKHQSISVDSNLVIDEPTRDVLYVNGILDKINLHIFIIHAPSRRNNNKNKGLRKSIFELVYKKAKEIYNSGERNIIVMGDFNDNPWDKSVVEGFKTAKYGNYVPLLNNLMRNDKGKRGSYAYLGEVLNFDQVLVSNEVLQKIDTLTTSSHIFTPNYLIEQNPKNNITIPFSTYKGMRYQGGVSDHLPVFFRIVTTKK